MLKISRTVITKHRADQMYDLVNDIPAYPQYLPWCYAAKILSHNHSHSIARVDISYLKIKLHFTTKNTVIPNSRIDVDLVDGPFKHLKGHWVFEQLSDSACKIKFNLDYKFSNIFIEKFMGSIFEMLIKSIIDSFVKQADQIYNHQKRIG